MDTPRAHSRFAVTMGGALLIFLGATVLSNAGSVTTFVVRLVGFASLVFGVMTLADLLKRAHSLDEIPFGELAFSGVLTLIGSAVALFPNMFARVLIRALGVLIFLSGLEDVRRSRTMTADEESEEKYFLRIGIITMAVGAFVTLVPIAMVHALPFVCGVALVVDGLSELYLALKMEG